MTNKNTISYESVALLRNQAYTSSYSDNINFIAAKKLIGEKKFVMYNCIFSFRYIYVLLLSFYSIDSSY